MEFMKARLGDCRLYKFDVPGESDAGVIIVSIGGTLMSKQFQLTQYTRRRRGKGRRAGLSKSFVELVDQFFFTPDEDNLTGQIFDYIESNFSFKHLDVVPPACPVLVFHFNITAAEFGQGPVPDINDLGFTRTVLSVLKIRDSVLSVEDAITKGRVPIDSPVTVILDCYQSEDLLCSLCGQGYPKEDETLHKTKCNHIFHGTCISRHLFRIPQCPVCSTDLPPVDIRTLLFS